MRAPLLCAVIGWSSFQLACTDEACDEACLEPIDEAALFEQAYEEAREELKEDAPDCSGVRVPDRAGFARRVALTFDDGPHPVTTPRVLEILRRHRAPATFFTNGTRYAAPGAAALAREIAADPLFILANHGHRHVNLAQQSAATVAAEIDRTDALIRAAGEPPRYFRFPFGAATCAAKQAAQARGYIVTGWHIDSADWCYAVGGGTCPAATFRYVPDALRGDMRAYVMQQIRANKGGIVLFHDIHAATADALEGILITLANEGYTLVPLDDVGAFPKLHGTTAPVPATPFIGDACTTDAACAFAGGRCHAAGFCTRACAGACPDQLGKAPTFCIEDLAAGITPQGMCVAKLAAENRSCEALPGTEARIEPRFVGTSGAAPAEAMVCAPRP